MQEEMNKCKFCGIDKTMNFKACASSSGHVFIEDNNNLTLIDVNMRNPVNPNADFFSPQEKLIVGYINLILSKLN